MLSDAEQAREMKALEKISQYARKLNIDDSINIFTKKDVEYSVQPTDDGKELFVELESLAWKNLLNEIVSSALLKPVFELEKTTENQKNEQVKQEVEKLRQETEQTNLESERLQAIQEKQEANELKKEWLDKIVQDKQVTTEPPKKVSPSFDCKKATKPTEITICANSELAALDVENMKAYKKAKVRDAAVAATELKEAIQIKSACGIDIDCIRNAYEESISSFECVGANNSDCER